MGRSEIDRWQVPSLKERFLRGMWVGLRLSQECADLSFKRYFLLMPEDEDVPPALYIHTDAACLHCCYHGQGMLL